VDFGSGTGLMRVHRGGAGYIDYTVGAQQPWDGSILSTPDGGASYQIEYPTGAKDIFAKVFAPNYTYYFLTSQTDPAGNTLTYNYASSSVAVQLSSIADADGFTTHIYYEDANFTNQITKVIDPFNRTNLLQYDPSSGLLTNIVDVAGLTSGLVYDAGTRSAWITNLVTAYGTNVFSYDGIDVEHTYFDSPGHSVNRSVQVTLPTGGKKLFIYRQDCSDFLSASNSPVPVTAPLANTFDFVDQSNRNSFYWDSLQYTHLTTSAISSFTPSDYATGRLRHWLTSDANLGDATDCLSLERAPSQDGTNTHPGLVTWYDYDAKSSMHNVNNSIGTNGLPSFVAIILPDGTTRFDHYTRGTHSQVTQQISTYTQSDGSVGLRTNNFFYAGNAIDLAQWVGPSGEQVVSNYFNAYHQPLVSYDAIGQATTYLYNGNQQPVSITRPNDRTTTNNYFASGTYANWLSDRTDHYGSETYRTNAFTYTNGLIFSHVNERGLKITNFWDNLQRLVGVAYPDGSTTSNRFTALDITASKDKLGQWSYFGYNGVRQKIAETNVNGVVTRYGYCDCGALLSITNAWSTPVQLVTYFNYDFQGNRTYAYLADTTLTNWYNALAQVTQSGDGWAIRSFGYNNQGLLTTVSNTLGLEQGILFDIEDRRITITNANGVTVRKSYDLLGRVTTNSYPDGGQEKFGYSARGLIAFTNQIGASNYFVYDAAGRKTFETNANHEIIQYAYDHSGDTATLTDGKSQVTTWNYDEYGRVTNKLDQAGIEILRYIYDANGRITNRWSKAKGNTTYTYDAVGNLTLVNYPSSPDITLQYDWLDRLTNMVDASGTNQYNYTVGGELWTEDGPFASDTVTNGYLNRVRTSLALQQPAGTWTNGFGYDAARRLTNVVSQAGSFTSEYSTGVGSQAGFSSWLVKRLLLPNLSIITNDFDSSARLLGTYLRTSNGTLTNKHEYAYNVADQRTGTTRMDASTVNFTYDNIGQLTVADSSVNSEDRGFYYDSAWNLSRRTNNGVSSTFSVNSLNELSTAPTPVGASIYDDNGNLITSHYGKWIYAYDDENQLVSLVATNDAGGATLSQFVYDGFSRLRVRLEYHVDPPENPPQDSLTFGPGGGESAFSTPAGGWIFDSETDYIYDGMRVIQERDGGNNPLVSYTRGIDLSGSLEGAGGIGGLLARSSGYSGGNWTAHNFYHADGNGNVTYMLNASQSVVASYRYDPFGNLISKSGSVADANIYRFSSKEYHSNSVMYYYGCRFYDPNLQRWLSRDPLCCAVKTSIAPVADRLSGFLRLQIDPVETEEGPNLYTFVLNRPTSLIDLDGRSWWPFPWPKKDPPPQPPRRPPSKSPFCSGPDCQKWAKGVEKGDASVEDCYDCCWEQFQQRQTKGQDYNLRTKSDCIKNCERTDGKQGPIY
jgi:RHS repeat-associated protein